MANGAYPDFGGAARKSLVMQSHMEKYAGPVTGGMAKMPGRGAG